MSDSDRSKRNFTAAVPAKATLLAPLRKSKRTSSSQLRSNRKAAIDERIGIRPPQKANANRKQSASAPKLIRVNKNSSKQQSSKSKRRLQLLNPKSPTFVQDSVQSISSLRQFCQQCLGYVQQADTMLDQLQGTAKSLQEAGILQKLMASKGKKMSAADMTTLLFALMNTPLGASLFRKLTGGGSTQSENSGESNNTKT